jgi:hypothetical protein
MDASEVSGSGRDTVARTSYSTHPTRYSTRTWVLVVVIVIVVTVLAAILAWWSARRAAPEDCQECRMKPICSDKSTQQCTDGMDVMVGLDSVMGECAQRYVDVYGGRKPTYYLKEHPTRSYSYWKRSVYVLLRREDGTFYDHHTLVYVVLHELSHLMHGRMDGDLHSDEWKLVFVRLLEIAQERGHYDPSATLDATYPGMSTGMVRHE